MKSNYNKDILLIGMIMIGTFGIVFGYSREFMDILAFIINFIAKTKVVANFMIMIGVLGVMFFFIINRKRIGE